MKTRSLIHSWLLFLSSLALLCATMWFSLFGHSAARFAGLNPADYSFLQVAGRGSDSATTFAKTAKTAQNENTILHSSNQTSNDVSEISTSTPEAKTTKNTPKTVALAIENIETTMPILANKIALSEEGAAEAKLEAGRLARLAEDRQAELRLTLRLTEKAEEKANVIRENIAQEQIAQEQAAQDRAVQEAAQERAAQERAARERAASARKLALDAVREKAIATQRLLDIAEFEKAQAEMIRLAQIAETRQAQEQTALLMLNAEKARVEIEKLAAKAEELRKKRRAEQSANTAKSESRKLSKLEKVQDEVRRLKADAVLKAEREEAARKVMDAEAKKKQASRTEADEVAARTVEQDTKKIEQSSGNSDNLLKPDSIATLRKKELAQLPSLAGRIVFNRTRWDVSGDNQAALDGIFEILFLYPDVKVQIFVRSGDSKDPSLNDLLSVQRSKAIVKYLASRGLDPAQTDVQVSSSATAQYEINLTSVVELWVESNK